LRVGIPQTDGEIIKVDIAAKKLTVEQVNGTYTIVALQKTP